VIHVNPWLRRGILVVSCSGLTLDSYTKGYDLEGVTRRVVTDVRYRGKYDRSMRLCLCIHGHTPYFQSII